MEWSDEFMSGLSGGGAAEELAYVLYIPSHRGRHSAVGGMALHQADLVLTLLCIESGGRNDYHTVMNGQLTRVNERLQYS